ncbi:MAG: hypothetical protein ABIF01_01745 [Candidatus Micrarchaeota archaeon]
MARPPASIYGKVHCTTLIRFSKKEEQALLNRYARSFFFRVVGEKPKGAGW